MSFWTDQWKSFIRETSYLHNLREEKISNDQFWRRYGTSIRCDAIPQRLSSSFRENVSGRKKRESLLGRDPREDSAIGGGLGRMVLLEPRSSSETSIGPNPAERCHPTNPDGRRRRAAFCKKRRAEFDTHEPLKGMHRLWT